MRTTLTTLAFVGVCLLGSAASAQTVEISVEERDLNSFGTDFQLDRVEDYEKTGTEWKFNRQDCLENKSFKVTIKYTGEEPQGNRYFVRGTGCSTGELTSCDDTRVQADSSPHTFRIRKLLGIENEAGCTGKSSTKLYLYYEGDGELYKYATEPLTISWDFTPPAAPSGLEVGSGNGALFMNWDADDEVDEEDEDEGTDTDNVATGDAEGAGYIVVYLLADEITGEVEDGSDSDTTTASDSDSDSESESTPETDSTSDSISDSDSDSDSDSTSDSTSDSDSDSDSDSTSDSTSDSDSDSDSTSRFLRQIWLRAGDVDSDTADSEIVCPAGGFGGDAEFNPTEEPFKGNWKIAKTSKDYRLGGLKNGVVYKVAVATYDDYKNISLLSEAVCGRPAETIGFKDILEESGFDNKGYCFIATAAFGSYDHPTVYKLRAFRDLFLARMPGGQTVIETYYAVGPYLAAAIGHNDAAKAAVQSGLTAFAVYTQWLIIGAPIPQAVWFALLAALLAALALGTTRLIYRRIR